MSNLFLTSRFRPDILLPTPMLPSPPPFRLPALRRVVCLVTISLLTRDISEPPYNALRDSAPCPVLDHFSTNIYARAE